MEYFLIFLKGFAMGAANVIPGVSGGTIAFITGIYERLINALKSLNTTALKHLFRFEIGALLKHIDFGFLSALGLGVLTSVFTLAKVLKEGYKNDPVLVDAFFFGLIFASIFSVGKMVKQWSFTQIMSVLIGLALAVSLVFMKPASQNESMIYLLFCGLAGMCSMIIPGISGSFVLLLMGNYKLIVLDAVNDLRQMNFADSLPILLPVMLGAVLGMIGLSHLLGWLFKKYHDAAVALITGFVAGSLAIIWPWKIAISSPSVPEKIVTWQRYIPEISALHTWLAVGLCTVGVAMIVLTEKLSAKKG